MGAPRRAGTAVCAPAPPGSGASKVTNTGTTRHHRHGHGRDAGDHGPVRRQPRRRPPAGAVQRIEADGDQEGQEQREQRHELVRQDLLEDRQRRQVAPGQPRVAEPRAARRGDSAPSASQNVDGRQEQQQPGQRAAAAEDDRRPRRRARRPCRRSRAEARCGRGSRRSGCTRWRGAAYCPGASSPDSGTPAIGASANSTPDTACGPASPYQVGYASSARSPRRRRAPGRAGRARRAAAAGASPPRRPPAGRRRPRTQAHHQDLGRNEELHDQQRGQEEAVATDGVLLADHDLVQRREQEGRDDEHRDRHVAEGERRDDGRRVAEDQRRRDGARLPGDERPDGGEAGPGAERRGQGQRDVGGGDGPEEPRDRSQRRRRPACPTCSTGGWRRGGR